MKKVLALVLAVIMVCTMAMAVTINAVNPVPVAGSDGEIGEILLTSLKEKYVLVLDEEFFAPLQPEDPEDALDITKDNFVVTANVKGNFVEFENGTKAYAFDVANVDKALDGKVDFAITSLKISLVGSRNSYVTYEAKDGKMVATEYKMGGLAMGKDAIKDINDSIDFFSAYDVGYETNDDMDNIQTSWNDTESPRWNMFNKDLKDYEIVSGPLTITLTGVAKNTPFKVIETEVELTAAGERALDKNFANNGDPDGDIVTDFALEMTAGKATIEILGVDEDMYLYTYDKNGKLTDAGFKFVVEKDPRTGAETGSWVLTTNSLGALLVSDGPLTAPAADTTETGTTTNPGTGANDVVGVAAALAVVALVSGAAISLKK